MLHYLINFLFPPRCAACGARLAIESSQRLCPDCHAGIERMPEEVCAVCGVPFAGAAEVDSGAVAGEERCCDNCRDAPPHFTLARAVVRYRHGDDAADQVDGAARGGVVSSMIRRHKYGLDQSLAHALAECLGDDLPFAGGDYDLVMPVPLHRRRLRWRGFNQAAMLAGAVARRIGTPLDLATLVRVRETAPQTRQSRTERVGNLRRAFAVSRPARIASRRVLLVDDVMTTGATADECARTLLAAGARRVDVLTLARAV